MKNKILPVFIMSSFLAFSASARDKIVGGDDIDFINSGGGFDVIDAGKGDDVVQVFAYCC